MNKNRTVNQPHYKEMYLTAQEELNTIRATNGKTANADFLVALTLLEKAILLLKKL